MNSFTRIRKTINSLGLQSVFYFTWYQISLKLGIQKALTPYQYKDLPSELLLSANWEIPSVEDFQRVMHSDRNELNEHATEIMAGYFRMFGDTLYPVFVAPKSEYQHWTKHLKSYVDGTDIKYIWEPGRFGWATTLARAYYLTNDEQYPEQFWQLTEKFFVANPVNQGPQWASAQEVAIRLVALAFSYRIFESSPVFTDFRKNKLAKIIAAHAHRIKPSLAYAKAQNNNHLLTEAVGLYTAGCLLPNHKFSKKWKTVGKKWAYWCLENQISDDGTYVQQSANYHRLMLQTVLWFKKLLESEGELIPKPLIKKCALATNWLSSLVDEQSGKMPNLGPNDGAYYLPLTCEPFSDYRPVVNVAEKTFLSSHSLKSTTNEMDLWLGSNEINLGLIQTPPQLVIKGTESWGYLRAEKFQYRPGDADQLHFDLWWKGINIAQDAGTYLYNAPQPWENQLSGTAIHNTMTINGQDQMSRVSKFLWLDWAQAKGKQLSPTRMQASHDGYANIGLIHHREVILESDAVWRVIDVLDPTKTAGNPSDLQAQFFWLFPDWSYHLEGNKISFSYQGNKFEATFESDAEITFDIVVAGKRQIGEKSLQEINRGWVSPTYGLKIPAISLCATVNGQVPIRIQTTFSLSL